MFSHFVQLVRKLGRLVREEKCAKRRIVDQRIAFHPTLEVLETRELLAVVTWVGGFSNGDWNDNQNWKGGAPPSNNGTDTVQFINAAGLSVINVGFSANRTVTIGALNIRNSKGLKLDIQSDTRR